MNDYAMSVYVTLPLNMYSNIAVIEVCDVGYNVLSYGGALNSPNDLIVFAPYDVNIVGTNNFKFDLLLLTY